MKTTETIFTALSIAGAAIMITVTFLVLAGMGRQLNQAYNPSLIHQEKIATFNINQVGQIKFLKEKAGVQ